MKPLRRHSDPCLYPSRQKLDAIRVLLHCEALTPQRCVYCGTDVVDDVPCPVCADQRVRAENKLRAILEVIRPTEKKHLIGENARTLTDVEREP